MLHVFTSDPLVFVEETHESELEIDLEHTDEMRPYPDYMLPSSFSRRNLNYRYSDETTPCESKISVTMHLRLSICVRVVWHVDLSTLTFIFDSIYSIGLGIYLGSSTPPSERRTLDLCSCLITAGQHPLLYIWINTNEKFSLRGQRANRH